MTSCVVTVALTATVTELEAEPFELTPGASGQVPQTVSLTAGAGTITLASTGANWCWQLTEHGPGWLRTRFCVVTADSAYSALVDVDPGTFLASATLADPAWVATATAALAASTQAVAACTRPTADRIILVSTSGTDANSGRALGLPFLTIGAALAALGTSGGVIQVAAGTYSFSATLNLRSGQCIIGAGRNSTTLSYTGAGTAITSATPGVRAFGVRLDGLTLTTATGAVGVDFDSISNSAIYESNITGWSDACLRLRSTVNGGTVYNNFYGVTALGKGAASSTIAFDVAASGSNSNTFHGCSGRSSAYGLRVTDANHVTYIGGTIEANSVGVSVESSSVALADNFMCAFTRFEGQTVANWKLGATTGTNVRNPMILYPALVTDPGGNVESADRTHRHTSGGIWESSAAVASASGSFHFERIANGGSELPAMVVSDTVTSNGTPVTLQVQTERTVGYPVRATRGGVNYWDIDASGNMRQSQGSYIEMVERSADPVAPGANTGRIYTRDNGSGKTQLVVRFPTGAIQVLATEP